jgi:hypothetical protein
VLWYIPIFVWFYTSRNNINPVRKNKHKISYLFIFFMIIIIILNPAPTPANNASRWNDKIITSHTHTTLHKTFPRIRITCRFRARSIYVWAHTHTHISAEHGIYYAVVCVRVVFFSHFIYYTTWLPFNIIYYKWVANDLRKKKTFTMRRVSLIGLSRE